MASDNTGASRIAARIRAANGRFVGNTGKILRGAAMVYAEELVTGTAVDTGETRSNWRGSSSPDASGFDVRDPFFPLPRTKDARDPAEYIPKFTETENAQAALAEIRAFLDGLSDKEIAAGEPFFIVNPSWIARALDDGTIQTQQNGVNYIAAAGQAAGFYIQSYGKLYYV